MNEITTPAFINTSWLEEINSRDDVIAVVPFYIQKESSVHILSAWVLSSSDARFYYQGLGNPELCAEIPLSNTPLVHDDSTLDSSIGIYGKDVEPILEATKTVNQRMKDDIGVTLAEHQGHGTSGPQSELADECGCSDIWSQSVRRAPGLSHFEPENLFICPDCVSVYGMEYQGKRIPLDKAFDANWILAQGPPDRIVEIGNADDYILYSSGEPVGVVEHVIGLLTAVGGSDQQSYSRYNPEFHEVYIYVKNDVVAGYLSWQKLESGNIHRQLYVREEFQGEGIASAMILAWSRNELEDTQYYVDEPNDASRAVLESVGHLYGEEIQAMPYFPLNARGAEMGGDNMVFTSPDDF